LDIWKRGCSSDTPPGRSSAGSVHLYEGLPKYHTYSQYPTINPYGIAPLFTHVSTPEFVIDHLKFREASHFTVLEPAPDPCPPSDTLLPPLGLVEAIGGGNSLATHRSPWGEGVRR